MKKNMGNTDRLIRLLLSAIFAYLYLAGIVTGAFGMAMVILSGVFLLTSVVGYCPLYSLFGLNTCPVKK